MISNLMFVLSQIKRTIAFELSTTKKSQLKILKRILKENKNSEYGRKHQFGSINYKEYSRLPINEYSDIAQELVKKKMCDYELLVPTSGSVENKLIPYNKKLLNEFLNGLSPWIFDMYLSNPKIIFGKSYWLITPDVEKEGMIGFPDDKEYFGCSKKYLKELIIPKIKNDFFADTIKSLKSEKNLRFISVWSPSILIELCKNINTRKTWPKLTLISCWTDSTSKKYVGELKKMFPHARIQSKGLLSTEGIVSIPYRNNKVLAIKSHFYEFLDQNGRVHPSFNVKPGIYTVILTTSGGLYRYNTHDLVKITGYQRGKPLLKFLGRGSDVTDLVGEKIHEQFAENIIQKLCKRKFGIIIPDIAERPRYVLYTEADVSPKALEQELKSNIYYEDARLKRQLGKSAVFRIKEDGYLKYRKIKTIKKKIGTFKPKSLEKENIFDFKGEYL